MNQITVHMTKDTLYDFLLFHAYSKFSGFLVNILGLAVAFMGIIMYVTGKTGTYGAVFCFVAAAIFLGGTPLQLKIRAKNQVLVNEEYKNPVEYVFAEEGITVKRADFVRTYNWKQVERAVVTPKTIGIYYEKDKALILPKKDFGDRFVPVFAIIAAQLGQSRIRMR